MLNHIYRLSIVVFVSLLCACMPSGAATSQNAATSAAATVVETADVEDDGVLAAEVVQSWYPRTVTSDKGTAVIYAPQIDAWTDFETISGWFAFRINRTASDDTYYGSVNFDAQTDTDLQAREVLLHDFVLNELTIDGLSEESEEYILVKEALVSNSRTVPLDLVLEYLPQDIEFDSEAGLNSESPVIFSATTPALLLGVDAEPLFVPVDKGELEFVLNTNWDVLRLGDSGSVYLCYQGAWLTAPGLDQSWAWAESVPSQFMDIPDNPNWSNVRKCLPADPNRIVPPASAAPEVYYSMQPAELLQLDGEPVWERIADSGLSFATNTKQELFLANDNLYFLASGRWFEAGQINGPWVLTQQLPSAFQKIPSEEDSEPHAKSYVRKSVPGTREAWEAALVASIPRKAEILRSTEAALDIDVTYAGEPVFTAIETTEIEMAMNTSYQVFQYADAFYLCHNAVWFTGTSATGPWLYADSMPAVFASIPPSSPAYNTTFVTIEDTSDEAIAYAYTSGYENAYVSNSTVVYGTGYPPPAVTLTVAYAVYGGSWGYPHYPYYPWPPTYGYGAWYDPDTGRYGESVVGYGPYGAGAGAAVYNPVTGTYGRGQAVWDNDEFAGRGYGYNPNTNTSIARNRYVDFEDNEGWSERVARRGDEWRYTESEWEDGRMVTEFESSRGTEGQVVREKEGGDTLVSEGVINRGDKQASFETVRTREGDALQSEGSITGENRSATFDSVIEDGIADIDIQGSEGGTGDLSRQLEDGELSGSGTFSRDGKTIETDVTRNAEGVRRDFETSEGGQGTTFRQGDDNAFAFESGAGDVYAGRDGMVYKKTEDGWSSVENPNTQSSVNRTTERGRGDAQSGAEAQLQSRAVQSKYGSGTGSLERDYQSRQKGFDRYERYQSRNTMRSRGDGRMRRRR